MNFNNLKRVFFTLAISSISIAASAQGYLPEPSKAIQQSTPAERPSDVNTSELLARTYIAKEVDASNTFYAASELNMPATNIYTNWVNKGVKAAPGYAPSRMKIDLRGFHMPTPSRQVTSPFGQRWGRLHAGLDIKVYIGDPIKAAFDGKVRVVDFDARGYGNFVVIRHPNGLETLYGHMSKHLVKNNQIVHAGDPIGLGGNTGRSTGSHLHFETRICGVPVNPALMFDFKHQDVTGDFFTTTQAYGAKQ